MSTCEDTPKVKAGSLTLAYYGDHCAGRVDKGRRDVREPPFEPPAHTPPPFHPLRQPSAGNERVVAQQYLAATLALSGCSNLCD